MVSYRNKRIEYLEHEAIQTLEKLPQECKQMSMPQYNAWLNDGFSSKVLKGKKYLPDAVHFREVIDTLVDIKEFDFDETTPLEDIVEILK